VADDELLALSRIMRALSEIKNVEIVGSASNGAEAKKAIRDLDPDVVLLDIEMPDQNGFDVAEMIESCGGPEIIFVSAYPNYAVRAFETAAIGYILKPVDAVRLGAALRRARDRRAAMDQSRRSEDLSEVLALLRASGRGEPGNWTAKEPPVTDSMRRRSPPDDVLARRLLSLFSVEKIYRDPHLSLADVARLLLIGEDHVRRLIKQNLGEASFSTAVNNARLQDVKHSLLDPSQKHVPIATIAFDAGFGSLNRFNRWFKQATGLTPSEFRQRSNDADGQG